MRAQNLIDQFCVSGACRLSAARKTDPLPELSQFSDAVYTDN
jgi:hypothetical protein